MPLPDIALLTGEDGTFSLDVPRAGEYAVAAHGERGSGRCSVLVPGEGSARITLVI
ncbi:hypothetical protein [Serinicoccus sp. CNJ-927]|uniref:hypothetical protein n=1 Tax=Serinicoccus sp. CNJ-927 TaxID=1904970 RepID=UPI00130127C5|nr:hypothetical protein [Serinicoccus sp. CNJ-927]